MARLGDNPRLALLLGQAYLAQGDADRAQGQFERSIQLGRPFPDARVALARLRLSQKNVGQALAELDLAIREYGVGGAGGAARAYVEMAEAEKSRNAKRELVAGYYEEALKRDPANCDALWGAAKLQLDAGSSSTRRGAAGWTPTPGAARGRRTPPRRRGWPALAQVGRAVIGLPSPPHRGRAG